MITSLDNLNTGLRWWKQSNFPDDFLNDFYYTTYEDRAYGITEEWWRKTVDKLGQWRAYRGRIPPNRKTEILARGHRVLEDVAQAYKELLGKTEGEPSITVNLWDDIQPLYTVARKVKQSDVFAGKMCHFLFPNLFIVMDNLATQVFDYEFYWRGMKDEWSRLSDSDKKTARGLLRCAVRSRRPLHDHFPFETKLMELSHIGHKHG